MADDSKTSQTLPFRNYVPTSHQNQYLDALKSFFAGGSAGAISKTLVAPIERVKILMQTERLLTGTNSSIPALTLRVFRREGTLAFWRGNFANVVRIIPNKGVLFMCNEAFSRFLSSPGQKLSDSKRLLAGSLSGAALITLTYPLDLTQTRLATSTKSQYKGIADCMITTVRLEGLRGLYKGYVASVLGVSPYTGVQFYSYEKFKQFLQGKDGKTTLRDKLIAGAGAGAFAQTITYPLDTVRRRIQVQGGKADGHYLHYRGTWDCIQKIAQKEGLAGFYRGALVNVIRAAPSQAVQFACYGYLKDLLNIPSND